MPIVRLSFLTTIADHAGVLGGGGGCLVSGAIASSQIIWPSLVKLYMKGRQPYRDGHLLYNLF